MVCSSCGAENRQGAKFCGNCGSPLAVACPSCGAANEPGQRFCNECGSPLEGNAQAPVTAQEAPAAAERRLVSVLFADLVDFTALSENRDAEDVRELLSRYFEAARRVIERFGGTVEKFIGDAVMAVWGTPLAREDDAERAVRAALELVGTVAELDGRLQARAAVLTGEAAVNLAAEGEGMVAGDLVNTASRIQALAPPGHVLVGERTRAATDAAIAYEELGEQQLRGKSDGVRAWRARRVTAARGGAMRARGLEPPFVGREREFRLVKDLFHATAEEGRARLVSVVGLPGIGKSRLSWELEKYMDGLVEQVWWHRGRCLPYGEGVAFWALAEMVRMRARIAEAEEPGTALEKLRETLEPHFPDAEERRWVEARVAHLLGLAEHAVHDRQDLFSAWRLLFERLAEQNPCLLVFEDLQWADSALLDFVEYLLEWSRNHPLYVLTLARPELSERRPDWGAGKRNFHSLFLEPLPDAAMDELLAGLLPGLAAELRDRIRASADGVPLYAVETARMLLDRGLLESVGDEYRPTGPIESLEVPDSLHALIAARLDGLEPEERRLVADASVLGKTFTREALAALTGRSEAELERPLASLVRKEVLTLQADPRSPERGQYGFLQALVQKVAHDTLSRKERKARHLAAAAYFETAWGSEEEEIVEVIASHLLDAYEADPDGADAAEIKARARERLAGAGERAASLAAAAEARRYFEQAAALADDPRMEAELFERAGQAARTAGRADTAAAHYERAIALLEGEGDRRRAARATARLGEALYIGGQVETAVERLEHSFELLSREQPDEELAALAAELGRVHFFTGDLSRAAERVEAALEIAESLWLPEVLSLALNTKALVLAQGRSRHEESEGLLRQSLRIATENDLVAPALRAQFNLAHQMASRDRMDAARDFDQEGLALARRRGDRFWEQAFLVHLAAGHYFLGDWDEALATAAEVPTDDPATARLGLAVLLTCVLVHVERAEVGVARAELDHFGKDRDEGNVQEKAAFGMAHSPVLAAEGTFAEAADAGQAAFEAGETIGLSHPFVKLGYMAACTAALQLHDFERIERLVARVEELPRGQRPPLLAAQAARFHAHVAGARGDSDRAEAKFKAATAALRELSYRFFLAVALLEYAEWLAGAAREDEAEPLVQEAREIFERLRATPWLERTDRLAPARIAAEV